MKNGVEMGDPAVHVSISQFVEGSIETKRMAHSAERKGQPAAGSAGGHSAVLKVILSSGFP